MNPTIKVVKKSIKGWFLTHFDEDAIAKETQDQESLGWQLISSYGMSIAAITQGTIDTIVFIYRKK